MDGAVGVPELTGDFIAAVRSGATVWAVATNGKQTKVRQAKASAHVEVPRVARTATVLNI
ncbi:hypothetical protein APY04_2222 [Hyphomicrobium sulfonivorans]|uniref:Uncharacterized protein n=1 Tax=Hyphomicrobium sulfonivorans TaxID=121290 RepID=A0A109BE07_HYPSL|nr:hypothetical protein APY04_2222 [Hyphomicrobium sulfonivorans]